MSMLTSMCDRLHATARTLRERCASEGIYFPVIHDATNEMEDAAETILDLRNKCHDLQCDNAKLRESYDNLRNAMWDRAHARAIDFMTEDELRGLCSDLYDYVDGLKAFVRDMYTCNERDCDCTSCPLDGTATCNFEVRMHELGIEVRDE